MKVLRRSLLACWQGLTVPRCLVWLWGSRYTQLYSVGFLQSRIVIEIKCKTHHRGLSSFLLFSVLRPLRLSKHSWRFSVIFFLYWKFRSLKKAPCHLKKPFKITRLRLQSCRKEGTREISFPMAAACFAV